ncbi:ABC transporter ATP-binding protein [Paenibacillus sp. GP183]|jgi:oligopeptide/dipeptide ABC transporter ATP-binding protein|uniref:ABC transporter ATP-binding protein n=1 Tax=Paenibacillus sp. GP183 TaxID=1882751 RepID=UPI00089C3377|nr:ABC transporter ATP-binding protein [Paenibacillus sp. GP183]SEC43530.1 peptide/nickel transport system ATP-binding protein [Paenibacillus sp. GP183]
MLIEIKDLSVEFHGIRGKMKALQHVSFSVNQGEIVGIVGESGSGKSVTALSILGLLEKNAAITSGEIIYAGRNLLALNKKDTQAIRGKEIGMVFQEPMTALHPTMRVGKQLAEVIKRHRGVTRKEAGRLAIQALQDVQIHDPELVARKYPFELSGGMRQRVVIALAMAAPPDLLIADESTTALDVTIQYEILKLMKELSEKRGTAILLITHDLGIVAQLCSRVVIMYAGEIIEAGNTSEVLRNPQHPYTQALLHALPDLVDPNEPLMAISGEVPDLRNRPTGCSFASRCSQAVDLCRANKPKLEEQTPGHNVACWLAGGNGNHE